MQGVTTQKIKQMLGRRINSTIKLQSLQNHQMKQRGENQAEGGQRRNKIHSQHSSKSFGKNIVLNKLEPVIIKSTQKITIPQRANIILKPLQRQQKPKSSKILTQQAEKNDAVREKTQINPNTDKQQSSSQKMIRGYLKQLLQKDYLPSIIVAEQVGAEMTKIKPVWWNTTVTIIENIIKSIKMGVIFCSKLAIAYTKLQQEIAFNEKVLLSVVEDINHINIFSESFYFQRICILSIIISPEELFSDRNLSTWLEQSLKKILLIKKYMAQILLQTEEYFLKFNKLKKPSNLIREKKLIQINKILGELRESFNRIRKNVRVNKFTILEMKTPFGYEELSSKMKQIKTQVLQMPLEPYLQKSDRQYVIVINPQRILFVEDKKNTCIIVRPFAEKIIQKLAQHAKIVLFFHRKQAQMHSFMKQIDAGKIQKVMNSSYYSYRQAKKYIDLAKFGEPLEKIIVLDEYYNRFYAPYKANCIPLHSHMNQAQIQQIFDHLISFMVQHKEPKQIVKSLAAKLQ